MNLRLENILSSVSKQRKHQTCSQEQLSCILKLSAEHLFLFDSTKIQVIPEKQWIIEQIRKQVQDNLNETKTKILSFDIPFYLQFIDQYKQNQKLVTIQQFGKIPQQIKSQLNQKLIQILKNRITPKCCIQELFCFISYVQESVKQTLDITIQQIEQWVYYQEYTKQIKSVQDFMRFISILKVSNWQNQILAKKLKQLQTVNLLQEMSYKLEQKRDQFMESQFVDQYYHSQIKKLEEDVKENEQLKNQLQFKVLQLESNQDLMKKQNFSLEEECVELRNQITQLKTQNKRLNDQIQIIQFNHEREKEQLEFRIKQLTKINEIIIKQSSQLNEILKNLQADISNKEQQIANSKNIFESEWIKRSNSIAQPTTLGNQIRSIDQNPNLNSYSIFNEVRKLSIGSNRLPTVQSLKQQEGSQIQRLVQRVTFIGLNYVIEGYLNIGLENIYFENQSKQIIKIIPSESINQISIFGAKLILQLTKTDYIIQTIKIKRIIEYITTINPNIPVRLLRSLANKALRSQNKVFGVKQIGNLEFNPNKSILSDARWMGRVSIIQQRVFGKKRFQRFAVLINFSLIVFFDRSLKRVQRLIPVSIEARVCLSQDNVQISYDECIGYSYLFSIEDQDSRKSLLEQLEQIKQQFQMRQNIHQRQYRI